MRKTVEFPYALKKRFFPPCFKIQLSITYYVWYTMPEVTGTYKN